MHPTIKTTIHAYYFDISKQAELQAWHDLRDKLNAEGLRVMESWGGGSHWLPALDGRTITLECEHLFDNQWNTAPIKGESDKGLRVFDWALDAIGPGMSRNIKKGHWLEQTPAMREVRRNTMKCGYCGKQEPAAKGYVFCPHCIDSEYLEEKNLLLTRMVPVDESGCGREFKPLTEAERAHLLPLYRDAQLHGSTVRGKARLIKQRADIESKFKSVTANAKVERDGLIWLLDHGLKIDNVIYYSHTGRFGFGWRTPVDESVKSALLDHMSEFPFPYDIKCADGRTLSGG